MTQLSYLNTSLKAVHYLYYRPASDIRTDATQDITFVVLGGGDIIATAACDDVSAAAAAAGLFIVK